MSAKVVLPATKRFGVEGVLTTGLIRKQRPFCKKWTFWSSLGQIAETRAVNFFRKKHKFRLLLVRTKDTESI